ncbi:alpha-E domain-containing protein [Pyruvatibacter mobilis]|uniref:alpha-E domain-containing protein n=1 Tax=Pyruvatibacter mobilis TaxID=1712261 RepID=UPI003BAF8C33
MLSRSAENLFWIGRFTERAESMARMLEMGYRMALMPATGTGHRNEWRSIVAGAGGEAAFTEKHDSINQRIVCEYLIFDPDNPSSIHSCLRNARENGRAVRAAITSEMWMALNETWIDLQDMNAAQLAGGGLPTFLDWMKGASAQFRGATESSLLRNEGYDFLRLGSFIERADNTARLLDVKYYVLLPASETVGGGVDNYQWTTLLRALSSLRAFHHIYRSEYTPWSIADFLILNRHFPRSLLYSYSQIGEHLTQLSRRYGQRSSSLSATNMQIARLADCTAADIFSEGLHEFLTTFIRQNAALSDSIAGDYHFGWS